LAADEKENGHHNADLVIEEGRSFNDAPIDWGVLACRTNVKREDLTGEVRIWTVCLAEVSEVVLANKFNCSLSYQINIEVVSMKKVGIFAVNAGETCVKVGKGGQVCVCKHADIFRELTIEYGTVTAMVEFTHNH